MIDATPELAPKTSHVAMIQRTPAQVAKSLLWIREAQEHINSCTDDFHDPEALEVAQQLQQFVDKEWDSLGSLVAGFARPYSVLRRQRGNNVQDKPR